VFKILQTKTWLPVTGWVLYDLANTIYAMGILSLFFPLWVREQVGAQRADTEYTLTLSLSMAIIFFLSPLLGAMSDRRPRRMPFLVVGTALCITFTLLLGRLGYIATLICFGIANTGYFASLQFYDVLLGEVSHEGNRGRISGIGVGIGYFGSYIAVAMGLALGTDDKVFLFALIACLFLLFSLPCFIFVRERGNPQPTPITWRTMRQSMRHLLQALRDTEQYPGLLRFLIGRIFYTDAINTVVAIVALYTVNIAVAAGMAPARAETLAQIVMMVAISFAVISGFVWGWLVDRWHPQRVLGWVLVLWMGDFLLAATLGFVTLPFGFLYVVGSITGIALGGIWCADRPLMWQLSPPERIGEFYGLYNMVGRFTAIIGPAIWGGILHLTVRRAGLLPKQGQAVAILVLLLMVMLSWLIIRRGQIYSATNAS
jgi:MFS transporter, UMF1 family